MRVSRAESEQPEISRLLKYEFAWHELPEMIVNGGRHYRDRKMNESVEKRKSRKVEFDDPYAFGRTAP